jgi:phosphoribosyl 1,2-cyclic phosphodiesterase
MQFTILASGSTGNATLVRTEKATLLVDAGLSARKLEGLMAERGVKPSEVDAIVITHEHSDHIKGLGPLARKYHLPIYANPKTWQAMRSMIGEIPDVQQMMLETGATLEMPDFTVQSYPISHDAADPVGYTIQNKEAKLALATDLGYVSDRVRAAIEDANVLVLEANHDIEMLRFGRYPWNVKRRILGDYGHLSNEAAGEAMLDVVSDRTLRVYLAHLSLNHNTPDLARLSVTQVLESSGYSKFKDKLQPTYHDRPTPWDDVLK